MICPGCEYLTLLATRTGVGVRVAYLVTSFSAYGTQLRGYPLSLECHFNSGCYRRMFRLPVQFCSESSFEQGIELLRPGGTTSASRAGELPAALGSTGRARYIVTCPTLYCIPFEFNCQYRFLGRGRERFLPSVRYLYRSLLKPPNYLERSMLPPLSPHYNSGRVPN